MAIPDLGTVQQTFATGHSLTVNGKQLTKCTLQLVLTDPTGVIKILNWGKIIRIFLRRPPCVVKFNQVAPPRRIDQVEYDSQLCAVLVTNNGLGATHYSQPYGWVQTLGKYWLIIGVQGSLHIDWQTAFRMTRNYRETQFGDWARV